MRLSELKTIVWEQPYSSAVVVRRDTGRLAVIYSTEDGSFDILGMQDNDHDRRGLSKLEMAAVLADYDPEPPEETTTP